MQADDFLNLRAGPIIDAGGVRDSTVRAWIRNNGLILGDRATRESGNPRYDLADVARVTLMRFLFERLRMPAGPAVAITNAAHKHLAELAQDELAAIDAPGTAPAGKRYLMLIDRVDGMHTPEIVDHAEHSRVEGGRGLILEVRIELREVVRMARDRLASELGLSLANFRHDFVDAPEA